MQPLPWSPSSLGEFKSCPRQYNEVRVKKSVKQKFDESNDWGIRVHKAFEDRQALGTPLPGEMSIHETYMLKLASGEGDLFVEQEVALNRDRRPCGWFVPDVWFRAKIDFTKVDRLAGRAKIVDYKTGKKKEQFNQLMLYAIYTFICYPDVDIVDVEFYWTVDQTTTRKVWARKELPDLWGEFVPDLKQYVTAFKSGIWQPRPNGLCNGWCPVETCEHWREKREKR